MIAPACLAALAIGAGAAGADRLHRAEFWLEGPLERAVLHQVGHTARTRLEAGLAAGEQRLVRLPFADAPLGERAPEIERAVPPGAVLRFERWLADPPPTGALSALRPPLPSPSAAPRPAALAAAAAAAVLALAARRGWVALAAGLAGAAAAVALQPASPPPAPEVRVLEGDLRSGGWSAVRAARDELDVDARSAAGLVETRPAGAALEWRVELARERWRALAPAAEIFLVAPFDPGERSLAADRNGFAALESAFLREPAGAWRAIGAWDLGWPLPPTGSASGGPSAPPGWLAAGLPQGVPVLVARLREPEPDAVPRRGGDTWLRLVGFRP